MTWDLIGHEWAVRLLQGHIRQNRVRQAYLFTGPAGIGRRTLALRFAQALQCLNPPEPGVPCGVCAACRQIQRQQHPDLLVVQAPRQGGTLKVDQVRELQRQLALAPYQGPYRVALILRFEEAHPSAANALLKTLEEPPPRVVLLLTAESPEALLPTIVYRCEVLRLRPLAPQALAEALEARQHLPPEQAHRLAHLAHGRPGLALRWQQHPETLAQREAYLHLLEELLHRDLLARFAWAEGWVKAQAHPAQALRPLLQAWLDFWRDVLLWRLGDPAAVTQVTRRDLIRWVAQNLTPAQVHRVVQRLLQGLEDLERHLNPRLLVEVILLETPEIPPPPPATTPASPGEGG